jgi:hypothetical protein
MKSEDSAHCLTATVSTWKQQRGNLQAFHLRQQADPVQETWYSSVLRNDGHSPTTRRPQAGPACLKCYSDELLEMSQPPKYRLMHAVGMKC